MVEVIEMSTDQSIHNVQVGYASVEEDEEVEEDNQKSTCIV